MGVIQLTSTTTPSHDVSHLLTAVSTLPGQRTVLLLAASIVCSTILQRLHYALNTTLLALVPILGLDPSVPTLLVRRTYMSQVI